MSNTVLTSFKLILDAYRNNKLYVDVINCYINLIFLVFLQKEGLIYYFDYVEFNSKKRIKIRVFFKKTHLPFNKNYLISYNNDKVVSLGSFKYHRVPLLRLFSFRRVVLFSSLKNKCFISLFNLKKILSFNKLIVISTDSGFYTAEECVERKIGGILVCIFYF